MRDEFPSEYRCYTPPPAGQWIISFLAGDMLGQ